MSGKSSMSAAQASAIISELRGLSSTLFERQRIGEAMGKQYDGQRDLTKTLGYKKEPTYIDYQSYYLRNEIAKGVINAPVAASWETFPTIEESAEQDTVFERAATEIVTKFRLQQVFSRLDILSSLGKYAVLLLGFKDSSTSLTQPATTSSDLLYATPYGEGSITIKSTDTSPQSPRYGLPVLYSLSIGVGDKVTPTDVHYTRVIHVAQECLTNPVEGTPQLEVIFNRLYDIEKLVGADAEAFWRLADPGMVFNLDKTFTIGDDVKAKYEEKILDLVHRMKKFLLLQGVEAKELVQQISDPINHFSMQLDMVAAGKRIPKRVLLGSELGELASTMDLVRWFRQIKSRREQFCEPSIIRPFFDRLVEVGILKRKQAAQYNVKWDDLLSPSDKEKADVAKTRAEATATFLNSGGDTVIPIEKFLGWLGCTPEEIKGIMEKLSTQLQELPPEDLPNPEDGDDPNKDV